MGLYGEARVVLFMIHQANNCGQVGIKTKRNTATLHLKPARRHVSSVPSRKRCTLVAAPLVQSGAPLAGEAEILWQCRAAASKQHCSAVVCAVNAILGVFSAHVPEL